MSAHTCCMRDDMETLRVSERESEKQKGRGGGGRREEGEVGGRGG